MQRHHEAKPPVAAIDWHGMLIDAMRRGDGLDTVPLAPGGTGPLRIREFLTGVGRASR